MKKDNGGWGTVELMALLIALIVATLALKEQITGLLGLIFTVLTEGGG